MIVNLLRTLLYHKVRLVVRDGRKCKDDDVPLVAQLGHTSIELLLPS